MQKYFDNVTNRGGAAVPSASVLVKTLAGATATIYSDNGSTIAANPISCDGNGYFEFYAADGRYSITISGAGVTTKTFADILLEDPVDDEIHAIGGAALIGFTAAGGLAASNVQAALEELDTEKTSAANLATDGGELVTSKSDAPQAAPRYISSLNKDRISIREWDINAGADSDDTTAFAKAWADITNASYMRFAAEVGDFSYLVTKGPKLWLPAGLYNYVGAGLNLESPQSYIFSLEGDGNLSTRINVADGVYLIDSDNNPTGFALRDIHIAGGKGAIRFKSNAANAVRGGAIERCVFSMYTECAVGHESRDYPCLKIRNNFFGGASGVDTIGLALRGYSAGTTIEDNIFQRNRYHLKLAAAVIGGNDNGPAVPLNVMKNDFIRIDTTLANTWDVWFVPNQDTSDNAGRASVFLGNKFGNENLQSGDARVLVAPEAAGTYNNDKHHTTTLGGYVSGASFVKNNVNNNGNGNIVPFIKSYTGKVFHFDVDDIYDNGVPTFICEYDTGLTAASFEQQSSLNRVSLRQALACGEGEPAPVISNYPGTWIVDDPHGYSADAETTPNYMGGDGQGGYTNVLTPATTASFSIVSGAATAMNNSIGSVNEAVEVVFSAADGRKSGALTFASIVDGMLIWLEGELKDGATQSLDSVKLQITDNTSRVVFQRVLRLNPNWRKFRIPWVPYKTGLTGFNYRIVPNGWVTGGKDTVQMGRFAAYHATEPINTGHAKSLSSSWSAQHMILGVYHLWIDAAGKLRIKGSAPTTDLDGTVVGAQT